MSWIKARETTAQDVDEEGQEMSGFLQQVHHEKSDSIRDKARHELAWQLYFFVVIEHQLLFCVSAATLLTMVAHPHQQNHHQKHTAYLVCVWVSLFD